MVNPRIEAIASNFASGIFLRPRFMLEMYDAESPKPCARALDTPVSFNLVEKIDMTELSQKVNQESTEKQTDFAHDSEMKQQIQQMRRERLEQWMRDHSLNQRDVAERVARSPAYINLILSGNRSFGERTARHLERRLVMPTNWLDKTDPTLNTVPLWRTLQEVPVGMFAIVERCELRLEGDSTGEEENKLPPITISREILAKRNVTSQENLRTFTTHTDHMEPNISHGDDAVIDVGQKSVIDNEIYAIEHSRSIRLARLARTFNGGIVVRYDNTRHPEEHIPVTDVPSLNVLGRLVWRGG